MQRSRSVVVAFSIVGLTSTSLATSARAQTPTCSRTIVADVVALDQAYQVNRLGTSRPGGLLFALRDDVEAIDGKGVLQAGGVRLRAYKRPRPMVLRVNVGECLDIRFQNLLAPAQTDPIQPVTRNVSLHVAGLQLRRQIADDGTWVGANPAPGTSMSGIVAPGGSATYSLYPAAEGAFLLYSTAADYNQFGTMQLTMGLFGAVNVEPAGTRVVPQPGDRRGPAPRDEGENAGRASDPRLRRRLSRGHAARGEARAADAGSRRTDRTQRSHGRDHRAEGRPAAGRPGDQSRAPGSQPAVP